MGHEWGFQWRDSRVAECSRVFGQAPSLHEALALPLSLTAMQAFFLGVGFCGRVCKLAQQRLRVHSPHVREEVYVMHVFIVVAP